MGEDYPLGDMPPFFHFLFKLVADPMVSAIVFFGFSMMTLSAILVYIFTSVRLNIRVGFRQSNTIILL